MELEFTEKIKKSKELPAGLTLSDLHNQSISPDILSVGYNNHNWKYSQVYYLMKKMKRKMKSF